MMMMMMVMIMMMMMMMMVVIEADIAVLFSERSSTDRRQSSEGCSVPRVREHRVALQSGRNSNTEVSLSDKQ